MYAKYFIIYVVMDLSFIFIKIMHLIIYSKWRPEDLVCKSHTYTNNTKRVLLNRATDFGKKRIEHVCRMYDMSIQ